jgi:hypothetical protein
MNPNNPGMLAEQKFPCGLCGREPGTFSHLFTQCRVSVAEVACLIFAVNFNTMWLQSKSKSQWSRVMDAFGQGRRR